LCEDVIVIGSGAAEKMTWLDAYWWRKVKSIVHDRFEPPNVEL